MLPFVPVTFDVYRPLKPRLRWAMACLVSFADRAGRCFPSVRTLAQHAGISKSAAGRNLAELEAEGHLTRTCRLGGVYVYRIDRRFLPRWAPRKLSQTRDGKPVSAPAQVSGRPPRGVPAPGTEEKPDKNNQGWARTRARFANRGVSFGEISDDRAKWETRLRSWRKSGFWLPLWGPKPGEPGCFAP
jgi:DNA-binding transcriptional MocR family regulator